MKRSIVLAVGLFACGPKPSPQQGPTNRQLESQGGPGAVPEDPESICNRMFEIRDGLQCDFAKSYDLTPAECVEDMRKQLEDRGPEAHDVTRVTVRCYAEPTCDGIGQCLAALPAPPPPEAELRACSDTKSFAAVGVPRSQWERRKGANARTYSSAPSSKESPIEVCTIPAEMKWLLQATCDDGSRPFRSADHAHAARVGNVGPGGKCGSIIDLYEVPCPEKTYQIYIDAYVCPKDADV